MTFMLKFVALFAVAGLVISVVFGLVGGNRIISLITTALISMLISGGIGAVSYKVLELKVPEIFEFFNLGAVEAGGETFETEGIALDESQLAEGDDEEIAIPAAAAPIELPSESTKSFGSHILVNKVKIKNEPKLIAQAIRTMLARDEG